MKRPSISRTSLALAAALALAAVVCPRRASAQVFANPQGDHWAWAIALDPWAPTINGDLSQEVPPAEGNGTSGERFDIKIGPNDYLRNLKFMLPLVIDVRNQRFSILTDISYLDFSQDSNITAVRPAPASNGIDVSGNLGTKTDLKGLLWTEGFGWTVARSTEGSFLDLLVGVRFFGLKSETKWHLEGAITGPGGNEVILSKDGKTSNNENLWDGIFGIRGKARIGRQWAIPYYADIGAGTSKLTWSGAAGIAFEPGNWQFALSWRQISWSQKEDKLVQGLRFGGPALAIGYAF